MNCWKYALIPALILCGPAAAQTLGQSSHEIAAAHRDRGHELYSGGSILDAKDEFLAAARLGDSYAGQIDSLRMIGQISRLTGDSKSAQWAYSKALGLLRDDALGLKLPLQHVMCSQGLAATLDDLELSEDAMLEREALVHEIDAGEVWAEHSVVWGAAAQAARQRARRGEQSEAEAMYDRAFTAGTAMRDSGFALCVTASEASRLAESPMARLQESLAHPLIVASPYRSIILHHIVARHLEAGERQAAMELVDAHLAADCMNVSVGAVQHVAADLARQHACLLREAGRLEEAIVWIDMACEAIRGQADREACELLRSEIDTQLTAQERSRSHQ